MLNRRNFLAAAGSVGVAIAAVGWTRPAWAPLCPGCTTTSLLVRFAGAISYPPSPLLPAGETVLLEGHVHVVTVVGPNFLGDVYLNMAGAQGTGQTSSSLYIGTGSQKFIGVQYPPVPVFPPVPIFATFTLEPTNGSASIPFVVTFTAAFGSDGTLLPESTVTVGGGT